MLVTEKLLRVRALTSRLAAGGVLVRALWPNLPWAKALNLSPKYEYFIATYTLPFALFFTLGGSRILTPSFHENSIHTIPCLCRTSVKRLWAV